MLSSKHRPVQIFWQAFTMDKPTPQMKQTNEANLLPPTNMADGQQQQQLIDQWKDEGDGDSGLEDGAQADSLQRRKESRKLPSTTRTFVKKPILKSVRYVAKQKSKLVAEVPPAEMKLTVASSGAQGQQQVAKKSIWDRLGSKVGETSGKQATVGGKVQPIRPLYK
jgi:hypothetical protein